MDTKTKDLVSSILGGNLSNRTAKQLKQIAESEGIGDGLNLMRRAAKQELDKRAKKKNMRAGGTLKDIPPDNKGLPKLPTDVRNKMGFKKKGGTVKAKKGKFMCAPRKLEAGAMEMPKRNGRKRGA